MRHIWTLEEDNYLRENYPNKQSKTIAEHLKVTLSSVYGRSNLLGLNKSDEFKKSALSGCFKKGSKTGASFRFPKGHIPQNKGKKQTEYMNEEQIRKTALTRFKKGNKPHNTLHDGVITIRKDKRGIPYQYVKQSEGNWNYLHWHIWEKYKGAIPDKGVVRFKDGNTLNCNIENLELIDQAENMKLNTIHRYPDNIKELIRLQSKLNKTITKIENNGQG